MILCEWDAPEGDPGQSCVHLFACILSTSFTSVSISLSAVTLVYLSQWIVRTPRILPLSIYYVSLIYVRERYWPAQIDDISFSPLTICLSLLIDSSSAGTGERRIV
jgi:hypothetical protein